MIKNILSEFKHLKKYKKKIYILISVFSAIFIFGLFISSVINISILKDYKSYLPFQTEQLEKNLIGKVYFNNKHKGYILTDVINQEILKASNTIDICMYSFDNQNILYALEKAQKKGVKIKIILPKNKHEQHKQIFIKYKNKFEITEVGENIEDEYMHNKFILIDNKTLITGSLNYTKLQEKYDSGFFFKTNNQQVIEPFINEFNIISKNIIGKNKFRQNSYQPFSKKINFSNGEFEIWFGPGFKKNSIKEKMIDKIKEAKSNIDIISWQFTDKDIANALIKKSKDGIKIRIISDDFYIWSKDSAIPYIEKHIEKYNLESFEIISDLYDTLNLKKSIQTNHKYFNPYLHHHTLIIDNKEVITGTNNWSYRGFYRNDENILVSNIDFFVKDFINNFQDTYNVLRKKSSKINKIENQITLDNLSKKQGKIIIYNETSEIEEIPKACFETKYTTKTSSYSFNLPKNCNGNHSILYVLDNENNIIESNYINY